MVRHGCAFWICLLAASASGGASAIAAPTAGDALIGTWRGSAVCQGSRLDLSLRFSREDGALHAAISCQDFLLLDQPLDGIQAVGNHVRFSTPDEQPLRFEGDVDGDSLRGSATLPAVPGVARSGGASPAVRFAFGRDSTPPPPPYETREVQFASGSVTLAGTVLTPTSGERPHAGLVVLQGSSSNLRREYRFYADHFARAGLAVLTFDKRGNGGSSGDYRAAPYDTLAGDAAAAVEYLRSQPGVDPQRVGVWGLSQGAFIAPLVAARVPPLRFIVAISAPGLPIGESVAFQDSVRLSSAGFDKADVLRATTLNRRLLAWLRTGEGQGELAALLQEAEATPWRRASSLPARLPSAAALNGWYWRGRTLDPAPWWHAVHVPVLALYGAADELISARASAKSIERALRNAQNKDVTMYMIPSANHVIRVLPLVAGGKWDWPRAAPGYMQSVTSWVLERSRPGARAPSH